MIGFETTLDAPATARYNREAVEQIVQCVEEGVYCALLGPRLCGKTLLLRFIEGNLANLLGWRCIYLDLQELRASTQQVFFADLIRLSAQRLTELTGNTLPAPDESAASSAVFRGFLSDCLEIIGSDLVLIIDPLEALPTDLVQALLTSLRAAYMDQQPLDHHLTVVVSGALSLATLAVGESSPFRGIARRVFIGDLSPIDSQEFILELLAENHVSATKEAVQKLQLATSGDVFLMRRISQRCAERLFKRSSGKLRSRDVDRVTKQFLREEVFQYAPLIEAIRLIEDNPDLLECVLLLLEHKSVARADLPLPLSPDLDPLYLTGVVESAPGDHYRLQNLIYSSFLGDHFTPGQVGHVLAMAGRWDSAIDYLEASITQGDQLPHFDLLPATINSIYASQDLAQAVHFVRRGLSAAFAVRNAFIWFKVPQEQYLHLINPADPNLNGDAWADTRIDILADRLEARAYRQQLPLRGQEGGGQVVRAIPLIVPDSKPIGVVTIYEDLEDKSFTDLRERDVQMNGFLSQVARAMQTVGARRRELQLAGRVQASLLPEIPPIVPGWEIAAAWKPARETSGDFYDFVPLPDGRLGIVIADVVDKGMGAALMMTLTRTLIRTYAADHPDHPEQLLGVVNRRLIEDLATGLFVTLFYGVLDSFSGRLSYSNAGHPPPYLISVGESRIVQTLSRTGIPLGISEDNDWTATSLEISPSSLLLLYTDGVLDAQNPQGEFFSQEHMLELVRTHMDRPAEEIKDALVSAIYAFTTPQSQVDDITLMLLSRLANT
jgi:serine phosphatase RsbU (regulator of sigma subunit)